MACFEVNLCLFFVEEFEEYHKILVCGLIFETETPKYSKYCALDHYCHVHQYNYVYKYQPLDRVL